MTDTKWHINDQWLSGDEQVFRCYRHLNGEHQFVEVRVLSIWWRTQGATSDILRKAAEKWAREHAEGSRP